GLSIGVASILWSYSISIIGPSMTSFISKLNIPFSILLGVILLKEKLIPKELLGIFVTIIGVFLISYNKDMVIFASAIFTVFQALAFSFHSYFVKRIIDKVDLWLILFGRCFVAVIFLLMFGIVTNTLNFNYTLELKWIIILILSPTFGIVLNNFFRYNSLKLIGLSRNAVISSLEPVFTTILSIIILRSGFTMLKYVGGAVILSGLYIVIMTKEKKRAIPEELG
ncbi:MAG: DMT family transporter, partial [Nanoarchaeota archaeon]|nr:DMT family transporter [Nanoarchaeota archaeon]